MAGLFIPWSRLTVMVLSFVKLSFSTGKMLADDFVFQVSVQSSAVVANHCLLGMNALLIDGDVARKGHLGCRKSVSHEYSQRVVVHGHNFFLSILHQHIRMCSSLSQARRQHSVPPKTDQICAMLKMRTECGLRRCLHV